MAAFVTRLKIATAKRVVRLYPRRWRRRYDDEVIDLLSRGTCRWSDLFDLLWSVLEEWERELARGQWRLAKAAAVAYLILLTIWWLTGAATNSFAVITGTFHVNRGLISVVALLVRSLVGSSVFVLPFFLVGLVVSLPVLLVLRLARNHVSLPVARLAAAAALAVWGEWVLFQMEWFDVWRHGIPGPGYWLTVLAPWGLGFASAGAVIGGVIVRTRSGDPAGERIQ